MSAYGGRGDHITAKFRQEEAGELAGPRAAISAQREAEEERDAVISGEEAKQHARCPDLPGYDHDLVHA